MLFGDADCRSCILVVLVTATAVATTALVETLKTQHVVNDGVQNAPHVWNTQLRIDTRLVSELAATKNTLLWEMGWENRYRAYTSQQQLVCHWNVTHYCVTPLKYNDYTYLGFGKKKKKKNHLQGAWSNVSLDTAHLQEQVTITSQAHLQATPASEVLTKMEDSFQKLNPLSVIKGFRGGSLWGTRALMPFGFHSS